MLPTDNVELALVFDDLDALSDRELLLSMARDIRATRELATEAVSKIQPVVDGLRSNPMFKLLLK